MGRGEISVKCIRAAYFRRCTAAFACLTRPKQSRAVHRLPARTAAAVTIPAEPARLSASAATPSTVQTIAVQPQPRPPSPLTGSDPGALGRAAQRHPPGSRRTPACRHSSPAPTPAPQPSAPSPRSNASSGYASAIERQSQHQCLNPQHPATFSFRTTLQQT